MIVSYTNAMEIKAGQWVNRDSILTNGICSPPLQVIRIAGERIYFIYFSGRDGESYMNKRSVRFVCDTREEALEMFTLSEAQRNEILAIHQKYAKTVHQMTSPWKRDDEATQLTLMLVSLKDVPIKTINGWTDEQCQQAEQWAGAVHLHASDNDDVVVPPFPEFLQPFVKPIGEVSIV